MIPKELVKSTLQWQEYFRHDELIKTALGHSLLGFFYALTLMADRKQQDYGSANLTDFGPRGVLMRMYDKANRIRNLYFRGRQDAPVVSEEHKLETWGDWMVYEAIGWLMEAGIWPEGKGPVPNEPILEQEPNVRVVIPPAAGDVETGPAEQLILQSRQTCVEWLRSLGGSEYVPVIGHHYRSPRIPGTVVECAAVMPDFHDHDQAHVMVVFSYVVEPTTCVKPCYVCSPLEWFNDVFPQDVSAEPPPQHVLD